MHWYYSLFHSACTQCLVTWLQLHSAQCLSHADCSFLLSNQLVFPLLLPLAHTHCYYSLCFKAHAHSAVTWLLLHSALSLSWWLQLRFIVPAGFPTALSLAHTYCYYSLCFKAHAHRAVTRLLLHSAQCLSHADYNFHLSNQLVFPLLLPLTHTNWYYSLCFTTRVQCCHLTAIAQCTMSFSCWLQLPHILPANFPSAIIFNTHALILCVVSQRMRTVCSHLIAIAQCTMSFACWLQLPFI
jgi:hypothetical protein